MSVLRPFQASLWGVVLRATFMEVGQMSEKGIGMVQNECSDALPALQRGVAHSDECFGGQTCFKSLEALERSTPM